jgi:hypothetical protein
MSGTSNRLLAMFRDLRLDHGRLRSCEDLLGLSKLQSSGFDTERVAFELRDSRETFSQSAVPYTSSRYSHADSWAVRAAAVIRIEVSRRLPAEHSEGWYPCMTTARPSAPAFA